MWRSLKKKLIVSFFGTSRGPKKKHPPPSLSSSVLSLQAMCDEDMTLSSYELLRRSNIARNNELLASLGLGDAVLIPKKSAACVPRPKVPTTSDGKCAPDVRRSTRNTGHTVYESLSENFMSKEEKMCERSYAKKTARPKTYSANPSQSTKRKVSHDHIAGTSDETGKRRSEAVDTHSSFNGIQPAVSSRASSSSLFFVGGKVPVAPYPTKGKKYTCEFCRGEFVMTKKGPRVHTCVSVDTSHLW